MRRWILFLVCLVSSYTIQAKNTESEIQKGLVLVNVALVDYDQLRPWIKKPGQNYTSIGLVVSNHKILTLASDVRHAANVEITKYSSYKKYSAKVSSFDLESNLALLTVEDSEFFADLQPLPMADDPRPGERVEIVSINHLFRVLRENNEVVSYDLVMDFGFAEMPSFKVKTKDNFSSGGIFLTTKGVGGYLSFGGERNEVLAVPASVLSWFLKHEGTEGFKGAVAQGLTLESLDSAAARSFLKLQKANGGAYVGRPIVGTSSFGVLQEGDILLKVASKDIDDKGYYVDEIWGKQKASLLFVRDKDRIRSPGEKIPVVILRKGETLQLDVTLKSSVGSGERVPWSTTGAPNYIVESGIVFLELSVPYLRAAFGQNWKTAAVDLAYIYETSRYYEKPSDDKIVILSAVLPDETNTGYESLEGSVVISANGKKLQNLKHLHDLLSKNKSLIELQIGFGPKIFLDGSDRQESNARVAKKYRIPKNSSYE